MLGTFSMAVLAQYKYYAFFVYGRTTAHDMDRKLGSTRRYEQATNPIMAVECCINVLIGARQSNSTTGFNTGVFLVRARKNDITPAQSQQRPYVHPSMWNAVEKY